MTMQSAAPTYDPMLLVIAGGIVPMALFFLNLVATALGSYLTRKRERLEAARKREFGRAEELHEGLVALMSKFVPWEAGGPDFNDYSRSQLVRLSAQARLLPSESVREAVRESLDTLIDVHDSWMSADEPNGIVGPEQDLLIRYIADYLSEYIRDGKPDARSAATLRDFRKDVQISASAI